MALDPSILDHIMGKKDCSKILKKRYNNNNKKEKYDETTYG